MQYAPDLKQRAKEYCDQILAGPWKAFSRSRLVLEALRQYEIISRTIVEGPTLEATARQRAHLKDVFHVVISLIYTHSVEHESDWSFSRRCSLEVTDLWVACASFAALINLKELVSDGLCSASTDGSATLVEYLDGRVRDSMRASSLMDDVLLTPNATAELTAALAIGRAIRNLVDKGLLTIRHDRARYKFRAYPTIHSAYREFQQDRWQLHPTWRFERYSVFDLHRFWEALWALAAMHSQIYLFHVDRSTMAFVEGLILVKTAKRWTDELHALSRLDRPIVGSIIRDLSHQPALYKYDGFASDIAYQPFFPVGRELLSLSNEIVLASNIERNHLELMRLLNSPVEREFLKKQELIWIETLSVFLRSSGFEPFANFKYQVGGENGECDLIIIDRLNKIGLACELKYLHAPEAPRQIRNRADRIGEGFGQAKRLMRWLKTGGQDVLQQVKMTASELNGMEFLPLVVSKNTLGGGLAYDDDVPVINEYLLRAIIGNPLKRGLRHLWRIGKEFRYSRNLEQFFELGGDTILINQHPYQFKEPYLKETQAYDASKHIDLDGLD